MQEGGRKWRRQMLCLGHAAGSGRVTHLGALKTSTKVRSVVHQRVSWGDRRSALRWLRSAARGLHTALCVGVG
eukprot:6198854-Amphidinium_carterae.3